MIKRVERNAEVSDVRDHARRLAIAATALGMTMGVAPSAVLAISVQGQVASTEAQVKAPQKLATNYYKITDPKVESAPLTSQGYPPQMPGDKLDLKAKSKIKPTQLPGDTFDPKGKHAPR